MRYLLCALALSLGVTQAQVVNTVNDGATIAGGTYLNTPGSQTTFINSAGTGITLNAGQNIRGAEYLNGAYTGNGGYIHIQAPDQVVRLNGNIDVRSVTNTSGPIHNLGEVSTGGTVMVDAAYLYQNGNIYAGGMNGGKVQFNVDGMTMGPTSRIDATGLQYFNESFRQVHGVGGNVTVNSKGDVDIQKGAFITSNGKQLGTTPENIPILGNNIVIIGRGVNVDGTLLAGQLSTQDLAVLPDKGTIRLRATGSTGDVNIGDQAILQTDGGVITIDSQRDINQSGRIFATGGQAFNGQSDDTPWGPGVQGYKGGTIALTAARSVQSNGRIQANGGASSGGVAHSDVGNGFSGGDGGRVVISAPDINNTAYITSMGGKASLFGSQAPAQLGAGGKGGTVEFIGFNPAGTGIVATYGGTGSTHGALGTIAMPNPVLSPNQLFGVWKKN